MFDRDSRLQKPTLYIRLCPNMQFFLFRFLTEHFTTFEPSKSVNWRVWCCSESSIGRFWGSKIVKGWVALNTVTFHVFWIHHTGTLKLICVIYSTRHWIEKEGEKYYSMNRYCLGLAELFCPWLIMPGSKTNKDTFIEFEWNMFGEKKYYSIYEVVAAFDAIWAIT